MKMEFKRIDEFLKLGVKLEKMDYLYENSSDTNPTNKEYNIQKLYFVTKKSNENLEIHPMVGDNTRTVVLDNLNNNWWVLKLPASVRKALGLDRPKP